MKNQRLHLNRLLLATLGIILWKASARAQYNLGTQSRSSSTANLTFNAVTVVNTNKPSVTIVSPKSGLVVSNAAFTVTGTASDKVGVSNVWYQLNANGWNLATPGNTWSNWTAAVTLAPGTNTIEAYAVNTVGNTSPTVTNKVDYVLSALLTVQTNLPGWGSISPNDNGLSLPVGSAYSLTATAKAGFAFTNWTGTSGQTLTNGRTLIFTMATNLILTANFVDTNRPTLTISSPTSNQQVTSSSLTIQGKVSDNVAVTSVWYNFNGGGWSNPTGLTNWSVSVGLNPNTNTISAYAVDAFGKVSPTNTVNFAYVDKSALTVLTFGSGTVSPKDNGVSLQVGQNYTLTAVPATGFGLTNWSSVQITTLTSVGGGGGSPAPPAQIVILDKPRDVLSSGVTITISPGAPPGGSSGGSFGGLPDSLGSPSFTTTNYTFLTNQPALTFTMSAGLVLAATFVDIAPPTVVITNVPASLTVSNSSYTFTGTAKDNVGVAAVYYQLNGSGWELAGTGNGWTNWTSPALTLNTGTNIIEAYAVDAAGNASTPVTNRLNYVFALGGIWNVAQFQTPAQVTWDSFNGLQGGGNFWTTNGTLSLYPNGTLSGVLGVPFTGVYSPAVNGQIAATIITADSTNNYSLFINAGQDTMTLTDVSGDGSTQELLLFARAPVTSTFASLAGTWNLVQFKTPDQLTAYGTTLTGGGNFSATNATFTFNANGTFTGSGVATSTGYYTISSNGWLEVTDIADGQTNRVSLFVNASQDTLFYAGGTLGDDVGIRQAVLLFERAPASASESAVAGLWNVSVFQTPSGMTLDPVNGLQGGGNFGVNLGTVTLTASGTLSGNVSGAFTGSYSLGSNGSVSFTINSSGKTKTGTGYLNATENTLSGFQISGGNGQQQFKVFLRAPK